MVSKTTQSNQIIPFKIVSFDTLELLKEMRDKIVLNIIVKDDKMEHFCSEIIETNLSFSFRLFKNQTTKRFYEFIK